MLITLQACLPALAYEQRVAILFGFKNYEQGQGKGIFRNLPFTANDLESVGTALREIGFDPINIHIYSDIDAPKGTKFEYRKINSNRSQLEETISKALESLQSDEQQHRDSLLLIYFTGHGGIFNNSKRMLAFPDTKVNNETSYASVWSILEQLSSNAGNVDKMLVIDACADYLGKGVPYASALTPEEMAVYLFSSSLGEMSFFDRQLGISVFTHYFVEAIKQADDVTFGVGNGDGKVNSEEIEKYVREYVPNHPRKEQKKSKSEAKSSAQHPSGSGGKKIELGSSSIVSSKLPDISGESAESRKARLSGYLRAIY